MDSLRKNVRLPTISCMTVLMVTGSPFPADFAVAVPVITAAIPQPDPNVVGLWLLDETEGPPGEENWGIYDQSGHGNHGLRSPVGVLSNRPQYRPDVPFPNPWNYSLDFGSSWNARVEIPDSTSLDLTSGFTVEAWVNLNGLNGEQYLVSKRNLGGPASGYMLEYSGGSQTFQFNVGTGDGYTGVVSRNFSPTTGGWHHVAAVHDPNASPSQLQLYIDGQLNNSHSVNPVVATNDDPLWLGNWSAGGKPANSRIDQVQISSRVVPQGELGYYRQSGPGQLIFGDGFETYGSTSELLTRSGGDRNHWKAEVFGPDATFDLIAAHSKSPGHAVLMQHDNAQSNGNYAGPYYNLPIGATRDDPIIATSGWVSFTGEENIRLFFQNQIYTGSETHYGVTETLLAGGIQYWGDSKTWKFENKSGNGGTTIAFSDPVSYEGDLDTWHYYRFIADYEQKEYISFQFDDQLWDLSRIPLLSIPNYFPGLLPVVDHNVRLLELPTPPHPYTAHFALDDAVISAGARSTGDYNGNGIVDAADYVVWRDTLGQAGFPGRGADGNNNGIIDYGDYRFWRNQFGAVVQNGNSASVPEPATFVVLFIAMVGSALSCDGRCSVGVLR